MTDHNTPIDDDFLDGCSIDFKEYADDEETAELRALFPKGAEDAGKEAEWRALFREDDLADIERRFAAVEVEEVLRGAGYGGSGRDTDIARRLRAKGLKVVEVDGWQWRGSTTFYPKGSVDHHTAGPLRGNSPSLGICINGRTGLPGPLCNVFIARDNTCYVVAAGRANHAGLGGYKGLSGNSSVYGVEHENTGIGNEPWREDQRHTAALVHAALLEGIGRDASWNCQHKEWTTRKIDKWDQSGADMRERIRRILTKAPVVKEDEDMPAQIWKLEDDPRVFKIDPHGMFKYHIPNVDALAADQFFLGLGGHDNKINVAPRANKALYEWLKGMPIIDHAADIPGMVWTYLLKHSTYGLNAPALNVIGDIFVSSRSGRDAAKQALAALKDGSSIDVAALAQVIIGPLSETVQEAIGAAATDGRLDGSTVEAIVRDVLNDELGHLKAGQ